MVPSAMAEQGKKCCLVSTLALHMEFFFSVFSEYISFAYYDILENCEGFIPF